jgi:hypothetical protein
MAAKNTKQLTELEIERRRDEALKRALGTPPKPHKDQSKREKKEAPRK